MCRSTVECKHFHQGSVQSDVSFAIHWQLQDDAFVEEFDKDGEAKENGPAKEEDEVLEGIIDSPEISTRRASIKASLHRLSIHNVHGTHKT